MDDLLQLIDAFKKDKNEPRNHIFEDDCVLEDSDSGIVITNNRIMTNSMNLLLNYYEFIAKSLNTKLLYNIIWYKSSTDYFHHKK